jgi:hypothetical protein
MNESWTGGQYSLYRALLGAFLVVHFTMLLPYGAELFGGGGVLQSASLSPYIGALPNPLALLDTPSFVITLLSIGALSGLALTLGWFDRVGAVLAAVILGWLYQRNPLIANPSLPLLGFLLVLHAFVPSRPFGSLAAWRVGGADRNWRLPRHLHHAAWVVLALSYSHSGSPNYSVSPGPTARAFAWCSKIRWRATMHFATWCWRCRRCSSNA